MSWLKKVQMGLKIAAQIEAGKQAFLAAVPGQQADCGTVKGLEAWGRRFDLPLKPIIR